MTLTRDVDVSSSSSSKSTTIAVRVVDKHDVQSTCLTCCRRHRRCFVGPSPSWRWSEGASTCCLPVRALLTSVWEHFQETIRSGKLKANPLYRFTQVQWCPGISCRHGHYLLHFTAHLLLLLPSEVRQWWMIARLWIKELFILFSLINSIIHVTLECTIAVQWGGTTCTDKVVSLLLAECTGKYLLRYLFRLHIAQVMCGNDFLSPFTYLKEVNHTFCCLLKNFLIRW